jgi:hypothetical protein
MITMTGDTIVITKPVKNASGMFQRDTFYPGGVHEREEWRPNVQHIYTLRGPMRAVKERIDTLLIMWPAAGYGTRVRCLAHDACGGDNVVFQVTRSHSCD